MKAKSHDRVSRNIFFCYRCRRYRRGVPAVRIFNHNVCAACK